MRVVGFIGSPRAGGNTQTLVEEVVRGIQDVGGEAVTYFLNKLDISPCQGCDACRKLGCCRLKDDMQGLYDELLKADAIIIGTPIYFWGPSAQTKAFLDRWYAIDQNGIRDKLAGKPILLVCAFADSDPNTARNAIDIVRSGAEWFKMVFQPPVLAIADKRGEVAEKVEYMQAAYAAGQALIQGKMN